MARRETRTHRQAFSVWYENERDFRKTCGIVRKSDDTLRRWAVLYGWDARAEDLDEEERRRQRRDLLARQAKLSEEQRKLGQLLRGRGQQFYVKHELDKASDAATAVKLGLEIERQAEGLPDFVLEILNADPDTLDRRIAELVARGAARTGAHDGGEGGEESG